MTQPGKQWTGSVLRMVRGLIFAVIVCAGLWLLFVYHAEVAHAVVAYPRELAAVTVFVVLLIAAQAANFLQLMDRPGLPAYLPTLHAWALANLTNYLGPLQPGLAVRLAFFRLHGITVRQSAAVTLRQLQLSLWIGLGLAAVALLFGDWPEPGRQAGWLLALLFVLLPVAARVVTGALDRHGVQGKLVQLAGYFGSVPPPRRLWLFVVQYLIVTVCILIVYRAFGADLSMAAALFIAVVMTLSGLLSIAPNNLGVQEAILAYAAYAGGLGAEGAVGVAVLFRIAHVTGCFLLLAATGLAGNRGGGRRQTA